jgi:hypothetical protein
MALVQIAEGPYIPHIFGDAVTDLYRRHRGWLTAAVHHSIPWPEKDVLLRYDGEDYFLRGLKQQEDRLSDACITVRFNNEADLYPTLNRIYRFTSVLGWFKRGYVDVGGYVYGSHPILCSSGRQPYMPVMSSGPFGFNCNFMPLIKDQNTRLALAFWREGLLLRDIHDGYSFLSFYKVIESQFKNGRARGAWVDQSIPTLAGEAAERIRELQAAHLDVGEHIFKSGRCAVAHASLGRTLVDPDIPEDRLRITKDLAIVQALAEKYIREELGAPNEMDIYRNRDALRPIYEYLKPNQVEELRIGGSVLPEKLGLNGLRVSINHWPHQAWRVLKDLTLSVASAHNGVVDFRATNDSGTLSLGFLLAFSQRKAGTNLNVSGALPTNQGGRPEDEIAFLEYQKAVIGNGIIEVQLPNGEKIVCEVVIPVNVDIGRTFAAIDERIAALRALRQEVIGNGKNGYGA